jgi:predicted nucleic acid-binding protein
VRVLLDTDVLLDIGLRRPRFFAASGAVLEWAESEPGQAGVAWHSLANISYLLRPDARPFIRDLLEFVEVAPTGTEVARQAVGFPMGDLEDALQAAAALAFGASHIVTRNTRHYRRSPVPAVSPAAFLAQFPRPR